jgi:hypothetical protein
MAIPRRRALERLKSLGERFEGHLDKLDALPDHLATRHWTHEVNDWLTQMEAMVPHVGAKTGAEWAGRIAAGRARIGERSDVS